MLRIALGILLLSAVAAHGQDFSALEERRPLADRPHVTTAAKASPLDQPRVLIIGDSWAQYMWDDGSHNDILDRFGLADHQALSISLGSDPGPGYAGPEVAISGSEARQWVDTANFPWIANTVALLQANPGVDRVALSIGGNDLLAGRSDGGWYKDMDLDVPGSEAALFAVLEADTRTIVDAVLAVRPEIEIVLSSYDYPNFNVGFWCFVYACPKRDDLSRDPSGDLITDAEINGFMVQVETYRRAWAASWDRVSYDNSIGLMHHVYGDGITPAWGLPRPGTEPLDYEPFPGGNPSLPSLRSAFRLPNGLDADPIHLDFDGYQHKIGQQVLAQLLPAYRGDPRRTSVASGGGWSDGSQAAEGTLRVGDDGSSRIVSILDLDVSGIPTTAEFDRAAVYLSRSGSFGENPFVSGALGGPIVDLAVGYFGSDPAIEPDDLDAPADLADAAWAVGSVQADRYTLRLEWKPEALALLNGADRVQLRLSFPGLTTGTADWIEFAGVGSGPPVRQDIATFAWAEDTTAPVVDLYFQMPTASPLPGRSVARLMPNVPNPFNPRTMLRFELERSGHARLLIHDLRGRLVRVIHEGNLAAGPHERAWNGLDGAGAPVASGVYMATLSVGSIRDSQGLVLVR